MRKLVIAFLVLMVVGCGKHPTYIIPEFQELDSFTIEVQDSISDSIFYIAVGKQDTFWYAKDKNDSIYLWAIVKGEGIHLIRDIE